MKILSADDSATIRKIIKGAVEVIGYECLEAKNGKEALEILESESNDVGLVLLDLNMPELSGFEVLEKMQADTRFKEIPVMMVTTESERESICQAISMGAKHYVTKPFSVQDLSTRIMEALGMGDDLRL